MLPFLADALETDEAAAKEALNRLCDVLPAMRAKIGSIGVPKLAQLCSDLPNVSKRLIQLERLFPTCDVSEMVITSPHLLVDDVDAIKLELIKLQELFPEAGAEGKPGVDRMVQAVTQLLDAEFASNAIDALALSFSITKIETAKKIHANPKVALTVESASVRSRYSTSFDQTNVRENKVVLVGERRVIVL